MHSHKAIKEMRLMSGWTHCVDPYRCAATPNRQEAHGNVIYTDTCRCGATRESESNGGRLNYGPWKEPTC